jgi:transcriptional regulator with GAF, ATPase, and Fis domain
MTETPKAAAEDPLAFERLLSDLSARFVNLCGQELDREIEGALRHLVEFLGVSRANLFRPKANGGGYAMTHTWTSPGHERPARFCMEDVPWTTARVLSGKTTWFSSIEDLPGEALRDRRMILREGIRSGAAIPLFIGGEIVGALSFDSCDRERGWPPGLLNRLRLAGEVFANALNRREMEQELSEQLEFEHLLSEVSARFLKLPANEIDREVESALRRVVEFLGVDRGNLFQHTGDPGDARLTHSWTAPGIRRPDLFLQDEVPWVSGEVLAGRAVYSTRADDLPASAITDRRTLLREGIRSGLAIPLTVGGGIVGALSFDSMRRERTWPDALVNRIRLLGEVFANALVRAQNELRLNGALKEVERLRAQLQTDCEYLREEIRTEKDNMELVGKSNALKYVLFRVEQIAPKDTTVLVMGETGTGKELVARAIHEASPRRGRPLVKVNCSALPGALIESELFGHEKGAFSGADAKRLGRFEVANGTSLFLDEIGELTLEAQAKLLRVLQEGEFERVGSSSTIRVDVRIIAASNRDLERDVEQGRFREDLWYRLTVFPITVPPLRHRKEDIPLLVDWFVRKFSLKHGKTIDQIPAAVSKVLLDYDWPGNVRELENVIERAVITTRGSVLELMDPPGRGRARKGPAARRALSQVEHDYVTEVLVEANWRIDGPGGAARILGMNPSTLRSRMKKLGIKRSAKPL